MINAINVMNYHLSHSADSSTRWWANLPTSRFLTILSFLALLLFSTPGLALTDMQGNPKHFEDLLSKDKWTVFEVWSSQCPACPDAVFYMNNLKARYDKVNLIGISVDADYGVNGRKMAEHFIQKHKIRFPNLYSSTAEVDAFLHLRGEELFGTPSVLIFDPQGALRGIEVGAIISQDVIDFIEREESKAQ